MSEHLPLAFWLTAGGLLGLCVGSFLNVVIHRLPRILEQEWRQQCMESFPEAFKNAPPIASTVEKISLAKPGSRCPNCLRPIRFFENIPVISYLLLKGKCSGCHQAISWRYPLVELLTALLSAAAVAKFGANWTTLGALLLIWSLIALALIDLDTQLLPDAITLPLVWLGLFFNLFDTFASLGEAVIGGMIGYLALWSIYWLFKLMTGKEGMGYGDFKLLAALGAWLGWSMLPLIILLSSLVGAAVGGALIAFARHGRNVPIPFGPYLAAAGLIALFYGQTLIRYYLQ